LNGVPERIFGKEGGRESYNGVERNKVTGTWAQEGNARRGLCVQLSWKGRGGGGKDRRRG